MRGWQVDPARGSEIEAAAVAAALAEWDMFGTTIRPDGGTEVVWCDDPNADPCLRRNVVTTGGGARPHARPGEETHRHRVRARGTPAALCDSIHLVRGVHGLPYAS